MLAVESDLNVHGVCHAALPHMLAQDWGRVRRYRQHRRRERLRLWAAYTQRNTASSA